MADSTLQAIRVKVRRITRSPSESQISTADLDNYINTAILYDFPEHLKLFDLRTTLTFYTQPNVDVYQTSTVVTDPLYNFKNKYLAVHPPIYLAGIPGFYTQWRDVFFGYWPMTNTIAETGVRGNGTTGPFVGIVTGHPMMQNNVIFTCLDIGGEGMILIDYPVSNSLGALGQPNVPQTLPSPFGQINYLTGDFTVIFPNNTLTNDPIICENIPYQPGKPIAVLFYDNKFTVRPVPDKVYPIQFEADIRPTELIQSTDIPQIEQWWQYIAWLAAKKIFEDRMDTDSIQMIMPELKQQERLVLRSTLTLQANERTVTIYTQGKSYNNLGWFGGGWPY